MFWVLSGAAVSDNRTGSSAASRARAMRGTDMASLWGWPSCVGVSFVATRTTDHELRMRRMFAAVAHGCLGGAAPTESDAVIINCKCRAVSNRGVDWSVPHCTAATLPQDRRALVKNNVAPSLCCLLLVYRTPRARAHENLSPHAPAPCARVAVSPLCAAHAVAVSIDVNTLHVVAPSIDDAATPWEALKPAGRRRTQRLARCSNSSACPRAARVPRPRGADAARTPAELAKLGIGFEQRVQGHLGRARSLASGAPLLPVLNDPPLHFAGLAWAWSHGRQPH